MSTNKPTKGDLKEEGGITKDEVVAFGEYDVLKEEVLPFCRICNSPALSRRICNSIYVNKQTNEGGFEGGRRNYEG